MLPDGFPLAAILSVAGLLVIAFVTFQLTSGDLPVPGGGAAAPGSTDAPNVLQTPTPSNVVVVPSVPPEEQAAPILGTLLYAKDGNIWTQTNGTATQITKGGNDSMPTFSPDGQTVYFVRTKATTGRWSVGGQLHAYRMDVPSLMSVSSTGGSVTRVIDGLVDPPGTLKWMGFIRTPAVSPDGRTIAIATDLPDPTRSDVVIKLWDTRKDKLTDPKLAQVAPLGHQDPAWRPDGKRLVYVRNDRDGAKGTPRIYAYDVATKKVRTITGPGYLHPSYSPDGRYIAATRTTAFGTDAVILNASTGAEVLRLTDDGESWAPVWSPAGDQIAYLHVTGQIVDLRLIQLEGSAPTWTAKEPIDLTSNAGLDGVSRPGWFIPADQLPATPAPTVGATPAASGS